MSYEESFIHQLKLQEGNSSRGLNSIEKKLRDLENFPLIIGKQCLYVMDWKSSKITYTRGVQELFGYPSMDFNMNLALNFHHPSDADIVTRISKALLAHITKNNSSIKGDYFIITYRIKKYDGAYIKVIKHVMPYKLDHEKKLISNLSLLSDISFMTNNDAVEWDLYAPDLDIGVFKEKVFREFFTFFSKREKEIIIEIAKGLTSIQIANKLFISLHTVLTHRKNILSKSKCDNTLELMVFCKNCGVL